MEPKNEHVDLSELRKRFEYASEIFIPNRIGRRIARMVAEGNPKELSRPDRKILGRMVAEFLQQMNEEGMGEDLGFALYNLEQKHFRTQEDQPSSPQDEPR